MKRQSSVLKTDEGESPPRDRIPVPPIFRQQAVFWFDATGPCLWLIAKEYFVRERGSQR